MTAFITTHHHFTDPAKIKRTELTNSIRRHIKRKEEYLERRCGLIWVARNRLNQDYIFARFNKGRADHIIVTLANYVPSVGWIVTR